MSEQPKTRQELYERIRQSSKDEYILEEMIRLGFWPKAGELPEDPADEIRERGEIQHELDSLRTEKNRLDNHAAMLRELRKRRLEASREKQKETKARREAERQQRAAAWQQRKSEELLYLGDGVSAGLRSLDSDADTLQAAGLPILQTPLQLAKAMHLSLGQLRFLAFQREVAKISHYVQFSVPKKTGGERHIAAPMPRLKQAQYWVLQHVLTPLPLHSAVHGFCAEHSIVSNATPHTGKAVVINFDIENFFPSISYRRIKGLFQTLGYSEAVATVLGLICSAADTVPVELDGERYFLAQGERHLPQGAPTSPALSNLICRRLDARLQGMAQKLGFTYTRYADDMSFSADSQDNVQALLAWVKRIVREEGFQLHPEKTRVMHRGRQQEVTGIVVNNALPVISRRQLRRFRALLFQIEKDGPEGKSWNGHSNVLRSAAGFANLVYMVSPLKGAALKARVKKLQQRFANH